jgi:hypothetical protein
MTTKIEETRSFFYIVHRSYDPTCPAVITISFRGDPMDSMGGDSYYDKLVSECKAAGRILHTFAEGRVIGDCIKAGGTHEEGMALVLEARRKGEEEKALPVKPE